MGLYHGEIILAVRVVIEIEGEIGFNRVPLFEYKKMTPDDIISEDVKKQYHLALSTQDAFCEIEVESYSSLDGTNCIGTDWIKIDQYVVEKYLKVNND
jgi:hypothetical protein